jgi:glutathione-specific gamma-glutamylcyclotransferase
MPSSRFAHPSLPIAAAPCRLEPALALDQVLGAWKKTHGDLWIFAYASLIWRPEFEYVERRSARVFGWHRALQMWSRINRGTPECPGLVFALLRGGSCQGVVFRIPKAEGERALNNLWEREMPTGVYDPRWLSCTTPIGRVSALGFTLCKSSPSYCGPLSQEQYQRIFNQACGRYGTTLDYAQQTYQSLLCEGIADRALAQILRLAP